jgi:hypothetical protein
MGHAAALAATDDGGGWPNKKGEPFEVHPNMNNQEMIRLSGLFHLEDMVAKAYVIDASDARIAKCRQVVMIGKI